MVCSLFLNLIGHSGNEVRRTRTVPKDICRQQNRRSMLIGLGGVVFDVILMCVAIAMGGGVSEPD